MFRLSDIVTSLLIILSSFDTDALSPVKIDSSHLATVASIILASAGILSPASKTI